MIFEILLDNYSIFLTHAEKVVLQNELRYYSKTIPQGILMSTFDKLHGQIMTAENNLMLTPQGSGGYDHHPETLSPHKMSAKPQSPAQHASVMKAGKTSAMKRKIAAGKPLTMI